MNEQEDIADAISIIFALLNLMFPGPMNNDLFLIIS